MLWEGFYHDFSTKIKDQLHGALPPDTHQGAMPPGSPMGRAHPDPRGGFALSKDLFVLILMYYSCW